MTFAVVEGNSIQLQMWTQTVSSAIFGIQVPLIELSFHLPLPCVSSGKWCLESSMLSLRFAMNGLLLELPLDNV